MLTSRVIAPAGLLAACVLCIGSLGVLAQRSAVHAGFDGVEARGPIATPAGSMLAARANADLPLAASVAKPAPYLSAGGRMGLSSR
jgi:hypothetical protein